jgi:hypothetical protein
VLRGIGSHCGLLLERERASVADARPWREQEQQARVCTGVDGVALVGSEFNDQAGTSHDPLPGARGDFDLAREHGHPCPFVHLVIVQAFMWTSCRWAAATHGNPLTRDSDRRIRALAHRRLRCAPGGEVSGSAFAGTGLEFQVRRGTRRRRSDVLAGAKHGPGERPPVGHPKVFAFRTGSSGCRRWSALRFLL